MSRCQNCPSTAAVRTSIEPLLQDLPEDIVYKKWTQTDGTKLDNITEDKDEFMDGLIHRLSQLTSHHFIARTQSSYFKKSKEELDEETCVLVSDFSENFSFVVQDCVQGYYWMNEQATVLPFLAYMKNSDGVVTPTSMCIISDHLQHDSLAVHAFLYPIIEHIKRINTRIKKIKYFTDGSAAQYKNKKNFANICSHVDDFGLQAEWHFYASCHGKSACDGIGGTLKRHARLYSLQKTSTGHISTPKELFEWADSHLQSIKCFYVDKTQVADRVRRIESRMSLALPVKGTRAMHCFIPINSFQLKASPLSIECDFKVFHVLPDEIPFDYTSCKEGDVVVWMKPNGCWQMAKILSANPDENAYEVNLFTPDGERGFLQGYHLVNKKVIIDCSDVIFIVTSLFKTTVRSRLYKIKKDEFDLICDKYTQTMQNS